MHKSWDFWGRITQKTLLCCSNFWLRLTPKLIVFFSVCVSFGSTTVKGVEVLKTRWSWFIGTEPANIACGVCVLTCVHLSVCFDSVDRIQQLKREYQLARREGMAAPYEDLEPRRRVLENDLHRVPTWTSLTDVASKLVFSLFFLIFPYCHQVVMNRVKQ